MTPVYCLLGGEDKMYRVLCSEVVEQTDGEGSRLLGSHDAWAQVPVLPFTYLFLSLFYL